MPEIQLKEIQKQLKEKKIWPIYILKGQETMKAREIKKRIIDLIKPDEFNYDKLDASECSTSQIIDFAKSMSLTGGIRTIEVRDAHLLKDLELIEELFDEPKPLKQTHWVVILHMKDLDRRKKASKRLLEHAAVVPCEMIQDHEKEAWIEFLAKRRDLTLKPNEVIELASIDPWSLDLIDQELAKRELLDSEAIDVQDRAQVFQTDQWVDHYLKKNKTECLKKLPQFVRQPDISIPLIGLIAWNLRQLKLIRMKSIVKMSPYMKRKLENTATRWSVPELTQAENALLHLDLNLKQTRKDPLVLWGQCLHSSLRVSN